jgi:zinc protease
MIRIAALIAATFAFATLAKAEIEIEEIQTPGGLSAWLVHEPSIPIIAIELSFRGGASLDAPGKEGAAYLMAGLLEEGAGPYSDQEFLKETERLAARFGYSARRDEVSISAQMLSENRDESIELLRHALLSPRFATDAVERVRGQVISSLRSDKTDPGTIARDTFRTMSFPDHAYGRKTEGTVDSVAALTVDDLKAAHQATLVKSRLSIGVVGDITADELSKVLDRLLGDLPDAGPELPARTETKAPAGITIVETPTPQSSAVFGQKGIARKDPDFFAAFVMNHILGGGGFSSRLTQEVREKRGLTYGVYSYLAPMDNADMIYGGVSSSNDRIAEAVDVIRSEWHRMAEEGVTDEELQNAKTYLTGAYPLRFDSNSKIAKGIVGLQIVGLPSSYIDTRNDNVNAVTREDIARVAKRLLDADALSFVVVGQPENLVSTN